MKCTIKDIARLAGVSPSTVSRVASGNARISEETRTRVRQVMEELHYQPNLLARSLVQRSASAVGVFTKANPEETMRQPFFAEALRGMAVEASRAGRQLLLSAQETGEEDPEAVRSMIAGGMVDGVVLLSVHPQDQAVALLREQRFPFVVIGRPDDDLPAPSVDNDNVAAGRDAAAYLLARGHRRIAVLGTDPRYMVNVHRLQGAMAAMDAAGVTLPERWRVEHPLGDMEAMRRLLTAEDAPTAVLALDDSIALTLLGAAKQWGIDVPGRLSLVAFNNNPVSAYMTPPLTCVEVHPYELGREAVRMLLNVLSGAAAGDSRAFVPTELLERGSVGTVAG